MNTLGEGDIDASRQLRIDFLQELLNLLFFILVIFHFF